MQRILIQLDSDSQPATFDRVVAIDAGAEHVLAYGGVTVENCVPLVHGAMFTRGGDDLRNTAIFVGGSRMPDAEAVFRAVQKTFFPGVSVSVMLDANGANTTAAAAVLAASRHLKLSGQRALVLGGTGPVGERAALLLALEEARVVVASREQSRAAAACERIRNRAAKANVEPLTWSDPDSVPNGLEDVSIVIAAGAAGITLLSAEAQKQFPALRVAVDLNAVPPAGLAAVGSHDQARDCDGVACYGAFGVGGTKMKIHRAAVRALFERNDQILDAPEIFAIGRSLE